MKNQFQEAISPAKETAATTSSEPRFVMERLGVVMSPEPGQAMEAGGVLNPASARRGDDTYLFARLVADGNYSRIGRARVVFDDEGRPVGVERLGLALEPQETWELRAGGGGVEDPRITFVPALDAWIMAYAALGPLGPRITLAASRDLEHWERLGPAWFAYQPALGTDLTLYPNKDAVLFPEPVTDPTGRRAYAMLHRPMWDLSTFHAGEGEPLPRGLTDPRPGIWISYAPADAVEADLRMLVRFEEHRLVALPEHDWEALKIGAGTPPVRIPEGWLVDHHGVSGRLEPGFAPQRGVRYSAGALVLDGTDPSRVVARSTTPLLAPERPEETTGVVPNVVFPTAIEPARGTDGSYDVYYGMGDAHIGAARLRRRDS